MTHVSGPDFLALQVRDLERAAAFYEHEIGLTRAYAARRGRRGGVPDLNDPIRGPRATRRH